MKSPKNAISFLIVIEALAMVVVLVLCIVQPWATEPKNDYGNNNTQIADDSQGGEDNTEEAVVEFSQEILEKVGAMTLEQKVAQMFIVTPEALTDIEQVTAAGNATKNAIDQYPVGGMVYSSENFQSKNQTKNMLKTVQKHYLEKFDIPVFLMVAELGGEETSPLAKKNRYTIEPSPAEVAAGGEAQKAIDAAKKIATYLKDAGFNTNLAPNVELYSQTTSAASIMVAETVSTYGENGICTVISPFDSEDLHATEAESLVYKAGLDAGADAMMLSDITDRMVKYLRTNMQYGGVLIADGLTENTVSTAVRSGADMIYCPENFKDAYQKVLDDVNSGMISEELINTAVARILTCKGSIGRE